MPTVVQLLAREGDDKGWIFWVHASSNQDGKLAASVDLAT
jgi:hypothetical protein